MADDGEAAMDQDTPHVRDISAWVEEVITYTADEGKCWRKIRFPPLHTHTPHRSPPLIRSLTPPDATRMIYVVGCRVRL